MEPMSMARMTARPPERRTTWQRYGLSITLAALFLVSWIGQAVTEWFVVASEAEEHGTSVTVSDYLWQFGQSTLENWQSEFLQLLTFVVLTTLLVHMGSPESRDSDDETRAALERIEAKVDSLRRAHQPDEASQRN
jgi:hypothetical protein